MDEANEQKAPDSIEIPQVETPEGETAGPVVGEQQHYPEGENPSDKGFSGTYPEGDAKLVTKADGQVWPADNKDAFIEQPAEDAIDADEAARLGGGVDNPALIPPAAGQETNSTVEGTATDPEASLTVADLQDAREGTNAEGSDADADSAGASTEASTN